MSESERGKSVGYDQAYQEGYAAKYDEWLNRESPYPPGSEEDNGFADGYNEAVAFAC